MASDRPARSRFADPRVALLRRLISRIAFGRLTVTTPSGERVVGEGAPGEEASLHLNNWRPLFRVGVAADIGFAQAMIAGECSTPDLVALLRLFTRNKEALGTAAFSAGPARWALNVARWARANTRRGAARNIMAHYDLGNAFFETWLDPSMSYSSALYRSQADSLETAQSQKQDRIVELLALKGGERALEVGCGWGGLAERLVEAGVAELDALTISAAQADYARQKLGPKANVELRDYRDIEGSYDRVVSIEMCEAVGEAFLPRYFSKLAEALKPGGRAVIQAIVINEKDFENYRLHPEFIQHFIFPGGFLPTDTLLRQCVAQAGLKVASAEGFGASYALTLAEWRKRFHNRFAEIAALGFDERFRRLWDYYLAYCEAGFDVGTIDVRLYALERG